MQPSIPRSRRGRDLCLLDRLPEAEREVILLSRIVGLLHEEVARATQGTAHATRSLLHRALARLCENLEGSEQSG